MNDIDLDCNMFVIERDCQKVYPAVTYYGDEVNFTLFLDNDFIIY